VNTEGGTIGGGYDNLACWYATVGGGRENSATGATAAIGGGSGNTASASKATVSGGDSNTATDQFATVIGGGHNDATGYGSTVAGGVWNRATGQYGFAAGSFARANHDGAFVWGDASTTNTIESSGNNKFMVRCAGGVIFYTDSGLNFGAYMNPNDSGWNNLSDRESKENFVPVDAQELVVRLAQIPINTWNYKAQDPALRHIGPVAQDFNELVEGLGDKEGRHINSMDADGVALASIQGLYKMVKEKERRIEELEAKIFRMEALMAGLMESGSLKLAEK
jgi:hypothetical protein